MQLSIFRALAVAFAAAFASAAPAGAQQYPSQPIKIIVSLAPGGVADIVARAFAAKLGEQGKTVVVENRTGGARLDRRGCGREIAARRLHALHGLPRHAVDPAASDCQAALRRGQGFSAGHLHRDLAEYPDRASVGAGEHAAGVGRLHQGQSGQAQLRLAGPRQLGPFRRRAVQAAQQSRHPACALPGRRPGAAGSRRGPRPGHVRYRAADQGAARGGPRARAGDHGGQARARGAERADLCRARHARASRAARGSACSRRPARRARRSTGSMPRRTRRSRRPISRRGSKGRG